MINEFISVWIKYGDAVKAAGHLFWTVCCAYCRRKPDACGRMQYRQLNQIYKNRLKKGSKSVFSTGNQLAFGGQKKN